ncbi:group II intron maturase-specific domain-containing protein [Bradyrhizobium sp. UFLA06-06]
MMLPGVTRPLAPIRSRFFCLRGPAVGLVTVAACSRAVFDHRNRATGRKADVRRQRAQKQPAARRRRAAITQVGNDGRADIWRHRHQIRLAECGLEMHPTKTRIVYCRDSRRKGSYANVKFDFLGYCFRPRRAKNSQDASVFCSFLPGVVSASALKSMRAAIRDLNLRRRTHVSMADIARQLNPLLRGWIEYYGRFTRAALGPILRYVNQTIEAWMMRKFKRFIVARPRPAASSNDYLENVPACSHTGRSEYAARSPDGSPVRRESHAGIYERSALRFCRPTRPRKKFVPVCTQSGRRRGRVRQREHLDVPAWS